MRNRHILQAVLLSAALAASAGAYAASPTVDQVYQAAKAGRYQDAQAMMDQVLKEHPNSGRAHFVEAELAARQGLNDRAREELATAERLAPGLPFAKPAAVEQLRARLNAGATPSVQSGLPAAGNTPTVQSGVPAATYNPGVEQAPVPQQRSSGGFGFGPILLIVLAIVAAFFFLRRRRSNQPAAYPQGQVYGNQGLNGGFGNNPQGYGGGYPPGQQPMGPGYGVPQQGSGLGSRIAGGLATGAALGAGMVAGQAIARQFGGHDDNNNAGASHLNNDQSGLQPIQPDNFDMGGNDFGLNDSSSWDDGGSGGGGGDDDWN